MGIGRQQREERNGHRGVVVWFTGLSGAGKTTLAQDRSENIRRAGETAGLLADAGIIVLAAFISPFNADRERVRARLPAGGFIEVHCDCPLAVCEQRDVKGLYRRARAGEVAQFTAISSPYEAPLNPELALDTSRLGIPECVERVLARLRERAVLDPARQPAA